MAKHDIYISQRIVKVNSHLNTSISVVLQLEAMNPFSRYLVIPQYFYFEYRDMVLINTAHP